MAFGRRIYFSCVLFFCATVSVAQKSPASESDLKKQADKLFEKENYVEATPMYSQLLSLYAKDAGYNYRYGICLLMSGQDKTGAASYLEAAAKAKETDADVNFYLGRSYMFMDHYNEAISAFTLFKKNGAPGKQSKLRPDVYIRNCENANQLRMDRKNVVVLNKTKVNRPTFFAAYDFTNAAGKLLTTPDRFLTSLDKGKMLNPVMFMANDGETIYYASYGKKGEQGKDIFRIIKFPDGSWSEPLNLGSVINTDEDEDYPYLDKDGRTLYFCSKGHNSIGGYDIFKSQYDFNSGRWSEPVNLGIPVNTVDDDIFYVPSTRGETAVYSTAIESESGKIELRNIKLGDVVSNLAVISGKYVSEDQVTRRDARITVVRTRDQGVVTSVKTDRTGDYELVLPAGEDYLLVVEGGSYLPHAENFSVPSGKSIPGMQQKISMNKDAAKEEMIMSNYFSPSPEDPAVASSEKPTQVSKSEFDLKDTASGKMQAITFDGKTLHVAPPSGKNEVLSARTVPASEEHNDGISPGNNEDLNNSGEAKNQNSQPVDNIGMEGVVEKNNRTVPSEKTSNAALVKMAFADAQAEKEEATSLREDARTRRAESASLDSLSKAQIKEANQLLVSGNKEQSQQAFKESQDNALQAQEKNKEAQSLEADAGVKDSESETSFRQASQLMKQFRVDTSSVAYHSIASRDASAATVNENNDVVEQKEETGTVPENNEVLYAAGTHSAKAAKLTEEGDAALLESLEMAQRSENATDKKQKTFYEKKSQEAKKLSDAKKTEAQKEKALGEKAGEQPLAVNESTRSEETKIKSGTKGNTLAENKGVQKTEAGKEGEQSAPASHDVSADKTIREADNKPSATSVGNENNNAVNAEESPSVPVVEMPVEPAAKAHYENYEAGMHESKKIETESKETEAKLLLNNTPQKRDSLAAKTSELNQQSIRQWQAAQKELALAKDVDPDVEEKMVNNSKINRTIQGPKKVAESGTTTGIQPAAEKKQPAESTSAESKPGIKPEQQTTAPDSGPAAEGVAEVLDTTKPEYPKYVETQKEILEKQTETVKRFVEGMQLNKMAVAMKGDEMKLRDKAEVTADKKEKARLIEKADSLAMEADIITNHSKEKLAIAQKNTGDVKSLTTKSDKLKAVLVVKEKPQAEQGSLAVNAATETVQNHDSSVKETAQPLSENQEEKISAPAVKDSSVEKSVAIVSNPVSASNTSAKDTITATREVKASENNQVPEAAKPLEKQEVTAAPASSAPAENKTSSETAKEKIQEPSAANIPEGSSSKDTIAPSAAQAKESTSTTMVKDEIHPEEKPVTETAGVAKEANRNAGPDSLSKVADMGFPASEGVSKAEKVIETRQNSGTGLNFSTQVTDAFTFSLAKGDAYSSSNPIPMDPVLPEGLVFKVQIGAFRKPLPDNAFKNLQPLSGETTRPGWIRYCLGLFRTFEPANLLKKEVRGMGYPDAFVVAYYNGKRIPLYDAYTMISKADATSKQTYSSVSEKEFSHLAKFEIKKSSFDSKPDEDTKAFYGTVEKVSADLVEYAVQVGVYKSSKSPSALNALLPLNAEQMTSGLFRFTTGRFDNRASADSMKRIAVGSGVKDAFVVIYRGGKKAGQAEAQKIIRESKAASQAPVPSNTTVPAASNAKQSTQSPPVSSADVVFKVQLGAFKENVPFNTVSSFLQIADKGISQETDARGLHIFYAGQYANYNEALAAREEILSKGVKDAFIVAFVKGRRTTATEALQLLNGK